MRVREGDRVHPLREHSTKEMRGGGVCFGQGGDKVGLVKQNKG